MKNKATNRSISLTERGLRAIEFLKANSINVSSYIEKILLNAVKEDFREDLRGEIKDEN